MAISLPESLPDAHGAAHQSQKPQISASHSQHESSPLHVSAETDPLWPLVAVLGDIAERICLQTSDDRNHVRSGMD